MEEEELIAEQAAAEAPLGENAESLETDLIEVAEDQVEAAEDEIATDEAIDTVEALEQMAIGLESAAAAGGLDKHSAHVVGIALDAMYARVGFSDSKSMPALESFSQVSSRIGATQLAMEEVQTKIAEIWKAIVAQIEKAIAWIKDRLTKIFDAGTKLKARAEALAKRAEGTKGNAKENAIGNARLFGALHQGGNVSGVAAATALTDAADAVFGAADKQAALAKSLGEAIKAGDASKLSGDLASIIPGLTKGDAADGMVSVKSAKELPGGKAIVGKVPASTAGAELAAGLGKTKLGVSDFGSAAPNKDSVRVLSTSDAARVAKLVSDFADKLKAYQAGASKLSSAKGLIVASVKAYASIVASNGKDAAKATEPVQLRLAAARVSGFTDQPAEQFSVYGLGAAKALLDYVELSLKQYEGAAAAE
jgi:hypothetical protein